MYNLFFIILCTTTMTGSSLLVEPDIPELNLISGTNYTIKCYGEVPITWGFEDMGIAKKNSTINIYDENIKNNKYKYKSTLSLVGVGYFNVGYYYCGPKNTTVKYDKTNFKKVYMFVEDDTHLLIYADNKTLYQNESAAVIIPCRPTTSYVKIVLKKHNKVVVDNLHFDNKYGFTHWSFWDHDVNNITCEAVNNGIIEIQDFIIHRNLNAIRIVINDKSDPIVNGILNLTCSVYTYKEISMTSLWRGPLWINFSMEHVKSITNNILTPIEKTDKGIFRYFMSDLIMRDVTYNDNGVYVCEITKRDSGHTFREEYRLNITNVLIDPNIPEFTLTLETHNTIKCYGEVPITWKYEEFGARKKSSTVEIHDEKITNNNYEYKSTLLFTRVSYSDAGSYYCGPKSTSLIKERTKFKNITIFVQDIVIYPNVPELTLNSDTHYTIKCYGSVPITWKYDRLEVNIKNSTIEIYDDIDKYNKYPYKSTLLFTRVSHSNTGSYICGPKSASVITERSKFKNIKISVKDETKSFELFDIILYCSMSILLVICVLASVMYFRTKMKLQSEIVVGVMSNFQSGNIENWNPNLSVEEQANLLPYDERWEFPIDKLKLGKQLGSGAFGVIFKATAVGIIDPNSTTIVAVKTIKPTTDPLITKTLISELKIMIHIGRHLNIVNLLGACTQSVHNKLMVIVEYCRFGCLHQYLLKHRNFFINQVALDGVIEFDLQAEIRSYENVSNLSTSTNVNNNDSLQTLSDRGLDEHEHEWGYNYQGDYKNVSVRPITTTDLVCWSLQISRGMEYLTSRNIVHGDLATRNILLSDNNIIKICDFGLAKNLYNSDIYKMKSKQDLLPFKWMAIESIRDRVFSTKSDVWSFGIVMWELFSLAASPYPNIQLYDLFDKLVDGYRMNQPKYANLEIYNLMLECWNTEHIKRPTFTELTSRLGNLLPENTKNYYVEYNDDYVRMDKNKLPTTDLISSLTEPNYYNRSDSSEIYVVSQPSGPQHGYYNTDVLELGPLLRA